jgi:hypothetical protein
MVSRAVLPNSPKVLSMPINPKQWSPCRCDMNTALIFVNLSLERRSCIWVPSPQSIRNNFPLTSITCADE